MVDFQNKTIQQTIHQTVHQTMQQDLQSIQLENKLLIITFIGGLIGSTITLFVLSLITA